MHILDQRAACRSNPCFCGQRVWKSRLNPHKKRMQPCYISFLRGLRADGPLIGLDQEFWIGFPLSKILGGRPRGVMLSCPSCAKLVFQISLFSNANLETDPTINTSVIPQWQVAQAWTKCQCPSISNSQHNNEQANWLTCHRCYNTL